MMLSSAIRSGRHPPLLLGVQMPAAMQTSRMRRAHRALPAAAAAARQKNVIKRHYLSTTRGRKYSTIHQKTRNSKNPVRVTGCCPPRWNSSKHATVCPNSTSTPKETAEEIKAAEEEALLFLAERGRAVGANLSLAERQMILQEAGFTAGKRLTLAEWEALVSRRQWQTLEKLTLSDFLAQSHDQLLGQRLLQRTALLGASFFALTGAHVAGEEAEFHVFGAALVGCITALGGGTINGWLTGATPVAWVRNPIFLVATLTSSLLGFYVWPVAERLLLLPATDSVEDDNGDKENKNHSSYHSHSSIQQDDNNTGTISGLRYGLETVALSALAVVGAQQGIIKGLHPLVSSCLGVTIALGGVMRDLLCGRDLTLGASTGCQSYGIASFSGAAVYVALRELHVWNCAGSTSKLLKGGIPIGLRILLGFGTVFGIRAAAWRNKPDGLLSTMEESADQNEQYVRQWLGYFSASPERK